MLLVSDRRHFWHTRQLSSQTEWKEISYDRSWSQSLTLEQINNVLKGLENKRCLLLVHGFNDRKVTVLDNYFAIIKNMTQWVISLNGMNEYDYFIGYLWPGYKHFIDYFKAEKNAIACAPRLKQLIFELSRRAARLDVLAHSMGNRLLLESLDFPANDLQGSPVHTFYSVAPAINRKSLNAGHVFFTSTVQMKEIEVFFSHHDPVEKWVYPIAEHAFALGAVGDVSPLDLPSNVQTIDCSAFIHSHSGYFTERPIYEWIKKRLAGEIAGPEIVQDVTIQENGMITIKQWRKGQKAPTAMTS